MKVWLPVTSINIKGMVIKNIYIFKIALFYKSVNFVAFLGLEFEGKKQQQAYDFMKHHICVCYTSIK